MEGAPPPSAPAPPPKAAEPAAPAPRPASASQAADVAAASASAGAPLSGGQRAAGADGAASGAPRAAPAPPHKPLTAAMMLSSAPPAGSVGASGSAAAAAARASASGAAQGPSAAASAATSAPADALARAVLLAAGSSAAAAGKRPREVSPSAHASAAALGGGGGPADVSPDAELEAPACEEGEDKIEQRVAIWNRVTRRKTSGKAAPMRKNLGAYLSEHADCEVYAGQDREGSCRRGGAEGGLGLHAPAGFFRADASARASGGGPGGCHLRPPTHPQLHHPQHLLGGAHGGRPMPRRDMDSPETGPFGIRFYSPVIKPSPAMIWETAQASPELSETLQPHGTPLPTSEVPVMPFSPPPAVGGYAHVDQAAFSSFSLDAAPAVGAGAGAGGSGGGGAGALDS